MIYGYENRNVALSQISDLCEDGKYESYKIDKTFVMEKYIRFSSGRKMPLNYESDGERQLLDIAKDGDTVITSSLANFSQSISPLAKSLKLFFEKGVRVIAILEDFDSSLYDSTALQELCDVLVKYSRHSYRSRMADYNEKKLNKSIGRKPLLPSDIPNFENYYHQYMNREINKEQFANLIEVSRPTLDKLIKRYSEQNKAHDNKKETD